MFLYDLARKAKRRYKIYAKEKAGKLLSPVRRIEYVAPPSDGLYVAMTFDDGPTTLPTNPPRSELGLTEDLLSTLKQYDARGTFDVIGTTADNYPDTAGPTGTFTWGGETYDHYPDFEKDAQAGVKNLPELTRRILDEGHEITSHTYRHILFGQNRIIYGKRKFYQNIHEVIDDLKLLDDTLKSDFSYSVKMSRPPHYIDKTCDKHSAYDAYRYMNYQYMAASFDGGGWQVSGDYQRDVSAMIEPMRKALKLDPTCLNGQIIFQKDGCNMSRETPVADALPEHLRLLTEAGYKVITVSELLELSPFEDTPDTDEVHEHAKKLLEQGYCVAHKNNTLQPDKALTPGELLMMIAPPDELLAAYRGYVDSGFAATAEEKAVSRAWKIKVKHPYFHAVYLSAKHGVIDGKNAKNLRLFENISPEVCKEIISSRFKKEVSLPQKTLTKRDVLPLLAEMI